MIEKREKTGSKLEPETAGWNDRIEPLSLVAQLQNLICKVEGPLKKSQSTLFLGTWI